MCEWKTLQQDIQRLQKRAQNIEGLSIDILEDMYSEGIYLRESLAEIMPNLTQEAILEMSQALVEGEHAIYREIYTYAQKHEGEARQWLIHRVAEFEKKVRELCGDVTQTPKLRAAQLQSYAGELLFLKRLAIWLSEKINQSILPDVFSEVHYLVTRAAENESLFRDPYLSSKLNDLRMDALEREVRVFQEEVDRILIAEHKKIDALWDSLTWGTGIQPNMSRKNPAHKPLRETCKGSREKLRNALTVSLDALSAEDKDNILQKFALDIQERAEDTNANPQEESLAKIIKSLSSIQEDLHWLKKTIQKTSQEIGNPKELGVSYKRLCKLDKRLTAELQERKLQERLEGIFGKRFVAFSENLILFLIFLVIGILVVESSVRFSEHAFNLDPKYELALHESDAFGKIQKPFPKELWLHFQEAGQPLSHQVRVMTNRHNHEWEIKDEIQKRSFWIIKNENAKILEVHIVGKSQLIFLILDTIICFIFLLEFFTKFFLAEGKWLYFRRHFLIDFLPSIPFGLITAGLQNLDYGRSARIFRLLRLQNLIRYIRIFRPMVRIFRVFVFLLRGTDRLVRRYSGFLNRNIIFFGSHEEVASSRTPSLRHRIQELRATCMFKSRENFRQVPPDEIKPYLINYFVAMDIRLKKSTGGIVLQDPLPLKSDLLVEEMVESLLHLQGNQVEDLLGRQFPYLFYQYMSLFKTPIIRSLPGIRQIVALHNRYAPPEFCAVLGRSVGRLMERTLAIVYWFSDLYGIVTGPKILDSLANTLIVSFRGPTKKLFLIGGIFVITNLLLSTVPLHFLQTLVQFLDRYIGIPLIMLGGICAIPLALGLWLRNVAGEATDLYERTAEAQFIHLLKETKLRNVKHNLNMLYERVIRPEVLLEAHEKETAPSSEFITKQMILELKDWKNDEQNFSTRVTTKHDAVRWKIRREVILLYKDYLDGPPLHRSDVKTTEQLLGNITLGNIRHHRLGYTKKDFKQLAKLDLGKYRIFTGPYLWFHLIAQSIAHNTANLLIEYNKHAIPESMMDVQSEEAKNNYESWLSKRLKKSSYKVNVPTEEIKMPGKKRKRRKDAIPLYLTTQFNMLHFLTCDENQDNTVRFNFGEDLYTVFLKDRKELIRNVFGTYPLRKLPRDERSINLYQLYLTHVEGGRIFTLPLRLIGFAFSCIGYVIGWLYEKLKEILHPLDVPKTALSPEADFDVAVRKINRMRKPVYMECMKLRAQFDYEYLGLSLPGLPSRDLNVIVGERVFSSLLDKDLDFIEALDAEHDFFYDLREERRKQLHRFVEFVKKNKWHEIGFIEYLQKHNPELVAETIEMELKQRKNEILRALAIAYSIDYRRFASLVHARETLDDAFHKVIEDKGKIQGYQWRQRLFVFCSRFIKTLFFAKKDWERKAFEEFWQTRGYDKRYGKEEKRWCWRAYLAKRSFLKDVLWFITQDSSAEIIDEIVQQIIRNPEPWTEELIAIRTIQTLTVMDVENYRLQVAEIGEYPKEEAKKGLLRE